MIFQRDKGDSHFNNCTVN